MKLLAIPTLIAGLAATADALTFEWTTDFSANFKIGSKLPVTWKPVTQKNDQLVFSLSAKNNSLTWQPPNEVFGTPGHWYHDSRVNTLRTASFKSGKFNWPIKAVEDGWVGEGFNYTFDVTWNDYQTSEDRSTSPVFHIS